MILHQNLHVHSVHSCDSACITMQNLNQEMQQHGFTQYGVTDHYHTRYQACDIASGHNDYLEIMPPENFHFGVEVSCVSKWECEKLAAGDYVRDDLTPVYGIREGLPMNAEYYLDITEDDIKRLGIEYVIAGCHWPIHYPGTKSQLIDDYFGQLKFMIEHPLVDIVAHAWWSLEMVDINKGFCKMMKTYDFTRLLDIPQEYLDTLGELFVKHNKLAEINAGMIVPRIMEEKYCQRYVKMLQDWKAQGVHFSFGDDLHDAHFNRYTYAAVEAILTNAGFTEEDFYLPNFKPGNR